MTNTTASTPADFRAPGFTNVRVVWDDEVDGFPACPVDLPPAIIPVPSDLTMDRVADWLSDNYGWSVKSISTVLPS